ncbi:uncharacterized protein EAF02_011792 [Botrytis sinoallii]|uniref:uncharacterized protein n=1 Tax=Botrytis sinoallii TaxID=1463999 RepID=UPI0018FFF0D2|nr:uncharacterized protein EAF02_011792 [Botrytis sinoallii]KAF7853802.1 hypothetical protein EAF02_011792 [Botrytis sinoallii]
MVNLSKRQVPEEMVPASNFRAEKHESLGEMSPSTSRPNRGIREEMMNSGYLVANQTEKLRSVLFGVGFLSFFVPLSMISLEIRKGSLDFYFHHRIREAIEPEKAFRMERISIPVTDKKAVSLEEPACECGKTENRQESIDYKCKSVWDTSKFVLRFDCRELHVCDRDANLKRRRFFFKEEEQF